MDKNLLKYLAFVKNSRYRELYESRRQSELCTVIDQQDDRGSGKRVGDFVIAAE